AAHQAGVRARDARVRYHHVVVLAAPERDLVLEEAVLRGHRVDRFEQAKPRLMHRHRGRRRRRRGRNGTPLRRAAARGGGGGAGWFCASTIALSSSGESPKRIRESPNSPMIAISGTARFHQLKDNCRSPVPPK